MSLGSDLRPLLTMHDPVSIPEDRGAPILSCISKACDKFNVILLRKRFECTARFLWRQHKDGSQLESLNIRVMDRLKSL